MDKIFKFVPKRLNHPNVPQAHPIENFWICLAQKVYDGCWEANIEQQLIRRIECKMKEFDENFVDCLLKGMKAKVRSIGDNSIHASFKLFFYLKINSLFREKNRSLNLFFSLDI